MEINGPQLLDGVPMTLEPGEDNHELSILFADNPRLGTCRKASVYDGTLPRKAIYDPPLGPLEAPGSREPVGYILAGWWPDPFLADIRRDPQLEPEFFGNVKIL